MASNQFRRHTGRNHISGNSLLDHAAQHGTTNESIPWNQPALFTVRHLQDKAGDFLSQDTIDFQVPELWDRQTAGMGVETIKERFLPW